jgi:hypothetical protein
MAQIECCGFGGGADRRERKLSFQRFEDLPAATGTLGGLVNPVGHDGAGARDDVLLEIGRATELALIGRLLAMGANAGCGDFHGPVDVIGNRARPGRMAYGCSSFTGRAG